MNRIEFMTELAALLQDVPIEERRDAMKYYNDYFDDAGEENEKQVVEELESPAKVAATIKADLLSSAREHGEFTEKGYTDSRFDHRDMPAGKGERDGGYQYGQNGYDGQNDYRGGFREEGYQGHGYSGDGQTPPRSSNALKIFLIIMLVVVGAPFIIPFGIAVIAIIFAFGLTILTVFASLVIVSVAVVFVGVCVFIAGGEVDCILAALASPLQEEFIVKNKSLLDARMWLGLGKENIPVGRTGIGQCRLAQFFVRFIFKKEIEKSKRR